MRRSTILFCMTILSLHAGCATVVSSRFQQIRFSSVPLGATVMLDGVAMGATPLALKIKTKTPHEIRLEKEGYEPLHVTLKRKINGWTFGNVVCGGITGFIVDIVSGANFRLIPRTIHGKLMADDADSKPSKEPEATIDSAPACPKIGCFPKPGARGKYQVHAS